MTAWRAAPLALLALVAGASGCARAVVQPAAPQQGQGQNAAQAPQKRLTDPKAICQAAADARKKTVQAAAAFAQKAPKGSWKWSDDGVNEAGNNLADALSAEAGALDGLVGDIGDARLVSDAETYLKLVKTFSEELETHADPSAVDTDVYSYEADKPQGGVLLVTCRLNGYWKKTA